MSEFHAYWNYRVIFEIGSNRQRFNHAFICSEMPELKGITARVTSNGLGLKSESSKYIVENRYHCSLNGFSMQKAPFRDSPCALTYLEGKDKRILLRF
jgi:hypothetical protein